MTAAIIKNLQRGIKLLETITDTSYTDTSVAPYYASIGVHIRHVGDIFECIFEGVPVNNVDFSARKRMELASQKTTEGIAYFQKIIESLRAVTPSQYEDLILVSDDLGLGVVQVKYTFASTLIQAHSHAIHHFASIGYIITQLGIEIPDSDFGFNPTTPRKSVKSLNE
ncbi:MAG: DinB family protein [Flavobacteriaceae bacterium]|nr:DinB family protein [Flavobacteriaceae bacterium]